MSNHQYPEHVVMAVADNLAPWLNPDLPPRVAADNALQALWDTSRIDNVDQIKNLQNDAIVLSGINEPYTPSNFILEPYEDDYPAHVVYWGDRS